MATRRWAFTPHLLLLNACFGGQSGDPGAHGPGGPDIVAPGTECQLATWAPDEQSPSTHQCHVANESAQLGSEPTDWDCDCGGTRRSSEAVRCVDALLAACDVDYRAATYCDYPLGTCFPNDAAGSDWLCRCGDASDHPDQETDDVQAVDCESALREACGNRCQSRVGSCEASVDGKDSLQCACADPFAAEGSLLANTAILVGAQGSCEATLSQACGADCESETGVCELDGDGFACACADETTSEIPSADLSSAASQTRDRCSEALERACGFVERGQGCSSSSDVGSVTCEPRPQILFPDKGAPSSYTFDCSCTSSLTDGGVALVSDEATSQTVEASSCEDAAKTACPGAIRPLPDPNGPTLDYGLPCTEDADCQDDACYVPGTKVNPICSKHCESDDDCPNFAHCVLGAGGYCFVRCEQDAECLDLNPSISNPLNCTTDFAPDEPAVCVQASEP